jgi:hypothetical protein
VSAITHSLLPCSLGRAVLQRLFVFLLFQVRQCDRLRLLYNPHASLVSRQESTATRLSAFHHWSCRLTTEVGTTRKKVCRSSFEADFDWLQVPPNCSRLVTTCGFNCLRKLNCQTLLTGALMSWPLLQRLVAIFCEDWFK